MEHNDPMPLRSSNPDDPQVQIREIVYLIRRLMQAGYLYTKELNKKYQVSAPQLSCLLALYENGPLPLTQIGRIIMVKSGTITGIIDRLEKKGFVQRTRNSPDRRIITIELTDMGKMLAQNAPPPIKQKIVVKKKKLPPKKKEMIVDSLNVLVHMLDTQDLEIE